jgi:hypothetical protein
VKLEQGMHVGGLRIRLTLQSEDTETHSEMSGENQIFFQRLLEMLGEKGRNKLRSYKPAEKKGGGV